MLGAPQQQKVAGPAFAPYGAKISTKKGPGEHTVGSLALALDRALTERVLEVELDVLLAGT